MGHSNSSGKLWDVLWCLLASLSIELLGALVFRSYMLWENLLSGVIDILLVLVNMWGLSHEDRDNNMAGWQIAFWSDVLFGGLFAFYTIVAVTHMFWNNTNATVNGWGVLGVAVLATLMNLVCSLKCPSKEFNGKSARLKLVMGAIAGGATIFDGSMTLIFGFPWLDIFSTVLCGTGIVWYISSDLHRRWLERDEESKLEGVLQL